MSDRNSQKNNYKVWLEKLSQVNLNEIDFKNAGSWPKAGKISAWVLAVLVTLTIGNFLYLSPKLSLLEQAKKQEKSLLQEFEIKAFQGANLEAYQHQMQAIQQQINRLSAQLPMQTSIPELIEQIGEKATDHRVSIQGLKLLDELHESAYGAQPLTLSVSGSYHNLALFLSALTQLERIVTLHDFTLLPDGKQLILTVHAIAYHNTPSDQEEDRD